MFGRYCFDAITNASKTKEVSVFPIGLIILFHIFDFGIIRWLSYNVVLIECISAEKVD